MIYYRVNNNKNNNRKSLYPVPMAGIKLYRLELKFSAKAMLGCQKVSQDLFMNLNNFLIKKLLEPHVFLMNLTIYSIPSLIK